MPSLDLEDIKIALRELSEIFRVASFIFLIPIVVTIYFTIIKGLIQDTIGIVGRISIFLIPALILYLLYLILKRMSVDEISVRTKHTIIAVALAWLIIPLVGSLPYILSGTLDPVGGFFESMSGWTTTGLTMIKDIGGTDKNVLFYRSLTHWVGGVGIVVMALVVFMRGGTVAMDYYSLERGETKMKPSIRGTVIETWKIYSVYTLACIILLYLAGMTPFDAITHSFATLATGGFSTHNANISYFHDKPLIEVVLIIFTLIGAISFLIHFRIFEGELRSLFDSLEFRYMIVILSIAVLIISLILYTTSTLENPLEVIRSAAFQSVSAMTTTGFSSMNIDEWPDVSQIVLIVLMYIGGFYGSSAGGIKLIRFVVIANVILYSIKRLELPRTAILRIKLGGKHLGGEEIFTVFGFTSAYLIIAIIGALLLMNTAGFTGVQSMFNSVSAISNVGLNTPSGSLWFDMPPISKIILTLLMWIGRLEIFPVLILLGSLRLKKERKI